MIRRIYHRLASLRLALYLILALVIVLLLGQWIPQRSVVSRDLYLQWKAAMPLTVSALEWAGFTRIYTAPVTLALWSLFFLNLSAVMVQRVGIVRKKLRIALPEGAPESFSAAYPVRRTIRLREGPDIGVLSGAFRKRGYTFHGSPGKFLLIRNRFAPVATILFHVSFILLLIGAVVMSYTRFTATVDIAEGEHYDGRLDRYHVPVRLPKIGGPPDVRFLVERVRPVSEHGTSVGLEVDIAGRDGERHRIEVNRPFTADGTSFVIRDYGVAPLVVLKDASGHELDGAYVKLDLFQKKEDRFRMHGLEFSVGLLPGGTAGEGSAPAGSFELKDPVFRFTAHEGQTLLAAATVRPGGAFAIGSDRLVMPEYRYWVRFLVVKERGRSLLYGGFALGVAALLWRFLFYRREIVGAVRADTGRTELVLAGRAEFYPALFEEELERIAAGIAAAGE